MCGICFVVCRNESFNFEQWVHDGVERFLRNRGPDSFKICLKSFETDETILKLHCAVSVLSMRGVRTVEQPLTNDRNDFLLFNGEIYDGLDLEKDEYAKINDSEILFDKLSQLSNDSEILDFVSNLQGPRSFVYFNNETQKFYLHRDTFGRCSLVWTIDETGTFYCCSVKPLNSASGCCWNEVPAGILCSVDLTSIIPQKLLQNTQTENDKTNDNNLRKSLSDYFSCVNVHELHCNNEKLFRMKNVYDLDSETEKILCLTNVAETTSTEILFRNLLEKYEHYVEQFLWHLRNSLRRRLSCLLTRTDRRETTPVCKKSELAIMFSGGVDSLLLTVLADEIWPEEKSIDLFNVSFEDTNKFQSPDRKTGRRSLAELKKIRSDGQKTSERKWNFVEINVDKIELAEMRKNTISNLISPQQTVLDDSIGCCLWFAARGQGVVDGESYSSSAKAVVVGSGADELLAGYSRHRGVFEKFGLSRLVDELECELRRIPYRNLGRDDRVIADHGREAYAPYLDERFVEYCNSLPITVKANLNLPRGVGEKLILRLALWKLGFRHVVFEPKRAMQFGTRIAKCENRKERGSDLCFRLTQE